MEDLTKLDLYELLGVEYEATLKEIKTAYRKKALSCHPDKNPDNPSAVKRFHELSRALEILTDSAAKDAYDKLLKARKAAQLRNRQLDSKRRKLKEDLERRERDAEQQQKQTGQGDFPKDAAKKLEAEIQRLRKEGSRQLAEEVELMKEQIRAEKEKLNTAGKDDHCNDLPRLKVTWKWQKREESPYTEKYLTELFEKYGKIAGLVMSSKGRALVEFETIDSAEEALHEVGDARAPLIITWVQKPSFRTYNPTKSPNTFVYTPMPTNVGPVPAADGRDYESIVLMRLRQAEERKRLIQQMKENEES